MQTGPKPQGNVDEPVEIVRAQVAPMAVLSLPVVLSSERLQPVAVLASPVVLLNERKAGGRVDEAGGVA